MVRRKLCRVQRVPSTLPGVRPAPWKTAGILFGPEKWSSSKMTTSRLLWSARPFRVSGEIRAKPVVAHSDGAVVHVVLLVWHDEGHVGEFGKVGREIEEAQVGFGSELVRADGRADRRLPVRPRVVFAAVEFVGHAVDHDVDGARVAVADRRKVFAVSAKSRARGDQSGTEVRCAPRVGCRSVVIDDALIVAREKVEVIRLARVA